MQKLKAVYIEMGFSQGSSMHVSVYCLLVLNWEWETCVVLYRERGGERKLYRSNFAGKSYLCYSITTVSLVKIDTYFQGPEAIVICNAACSSHT